MKRWLSMMGVLMLAGCGRGVTLPALDEPPAAFPVSVRITPLMTANDINAAMRLMPAQTRIVFEPGLYILTDPIRPETSEIELDGSRNEAVLWAVATPYAFYLGGEGHDIYMHNFTLEGGRELYGTPPDPFAPRLRFPVVCEVKGCVFW